MLMKKIRYCLMRIFLLWFSLSLLTIAWIIVDYFIKETSVNVFVTFGLGIGIFFLHHILLTIIEIFYSGKENQIVVNINL